MKYLLFLILSSCAIGNIGESNQFSEHDQIQLKQKIEPNQCRLSFQDIYNPYSSENYSPFNISPECGSYDSKLNIEPICISARSYYEYLGLETNFSDYGICGVRCKVNYVNFKYQSYKNCDDDWNNGCETEFHQNKKNCIYSAPIKLK